MYFKQFKVRNIVYFNFLYQKSSDQVFPYAASDLLEIIFAELNSNSIISETTFMKIISGLNETVGVVLDYLQDAKVL